MVGPLIRNYLASIFKLYNNNMLYLTDINECQEGTHTCTQRCTNTVGSYMCQCNEGFRLEDSWTCNGKMILCLPVAKHQ